MFAVEWLGQGVTVEREAFALGSLANAVTAARLRAVPVTARHPGEEPDGFRVIDDATGATALTVKMYDRRRRDGSLPHGGGQPNEISKSALHTIVSLLL
jgi:hypothetical protein